MYRLSVVVTRLLAHYLSSPFGEIVLNSLGLNLCDLLKLAASQDLVDAGPEVMKLPHEVTNRDGLVALRVTLVAKGYRYYFSGHVKKGKDPHRLDSRMIDDYEANHPRWTRERRKRAGKANFRYFRYRETFFLLATEGEAPKFWSEDRARIRDFRVTPLRFSGYSIGFSKGGNAKLTGEEKALRTEQWEAFRRGERKAPPSPTKRDMKWHLRVQIDDDTYAGLKAFFLNLSVHREGGQIAQEFQSLSFQPYAPVRNQLRCILRAVNKERAIAGFDRIPLSVLPFTRRIVPAFRCEDPVDQRFTEQLEAIA